MRRLLMAVALFAVPAMTMAQQPAPPQAAQPKAPKMASDDVMTLIEKGEVFFLDVREPSELEELGTPSSPLETAVAGLPVRRHYSNPRVTR